LEQSELLECTYFRSVSLTAPPDVDPSNDDYIRCFTQLRWNERETVQTFMVESEYDIFIFLYERITF